MKAGILEAIGRMLIYLQMIETEEDKTKFMRLYERYGGYLFTAAYQILGSGSDAEDAVHQTFLAVIKHLGQIKAVDTPEAQKYLLVIVERKAVDMLRNRRRVVSLDDMDQIPGLAVPPPGDHGLADAMARLPAHYRAVLLLRYDQGYTIREIAKQLDQKPGTIQKTIWRAKQALKKELGGVV